MYMENDSFNLEGAYNQLKEEDPFPWKTNCLKCGNTLLTEARVSYQPHKNNWINFYRPAYCPDCNQGLKKLEVKVFAAVDKKGKIYPRNEKGKIE